MLDGVATDNAINKLQQFYAAEKYRQLIADGISELDAHLTVSRLLGHERADVTNIYLAYIKKSNIMVCE